MSLDEIRKTKIEKVEKLRKAGIDPYPASSGRTHRITDAWKTSISYWGIRKS